MRILSIKELNTKDAAGYTVETDTMDIVIGMCTTPWEGEVPRIGFTSNGDTDGLIGATIVGLSHSDNVHVDLSDLVEAEDTLPEGFYTSTLMVNVATDRGIFQVVFYNQQDGCNSHEVSVTLNDGRSEWLPLFVTSV
jgi:hypothetical protein